jgi:uncharacterized integral membrane protein (TIGR00698 family)
MPSDPILRRPPTDRLAPGLLITAGGVALAMLLHRSVGSVGVLTWAVLLGAIATNVGLLPPASRPGLRFAAKRLLRGGIVLLGFSLPVAAIGALGPPVITMIAMTVLVTLLVTLWFGRRTGLGGPRSLLIATGFAICGASAVAAMQEHAGADEDDVATAIAMVTVCGTVAMIAIPLLQAPLGLGDEQLGAWAGASVHEVGQVIAAAGPAGAAAVGVAVVVKLTRVLLLAPVVLGVGLMRGRRAGGTSGRRPALVPLFVLGFLACVAARSLDVLSATALDGLAVLQTAALAAALFGLGTGVHLVSLVRTGGRALALGAVSTLVVAGVSLPWVAQLVPG